MLIYVVEDNSEIGEIERLALKTGGYGVEIFENVKTLREGLLRNIPDLIILDVILPDGDGINIVSKLRDSEKYRDIPVLMVSARNSEMEKVRGLDAGADDYLAKPFGIMELLSRVKALLRRVSKKESIIQLDEVLLDEEKREVKYLGRDVNLTYKEFELLKYLMINKGIVLSRDKIMEKVWGFDFQGESRTVDMHIKTLRKKLNDKENKKIQTVRNVGYKFC